MQLNELFPPTAFATKEDFPTAVQILNAAINCIHFERRNARNVGFRGLRPFPMMSFDKDIMFQGWTCRILHSPLIFAILYMGEKNNIKPFQSESQSEQIQKWSSFALLGFPPKNSDLLEDFSLQALDIADKEDYDDKIRNWGFSSEECAAFHLGTFYMGIDAILETHTSHAATGEFSMTLLLEAKETLRTICLDGIGFEENGKQNWLIEPNGDDAKIPAFSLITPFFETLARTLGTVYSPNECGHSMQYQCADSSLAYTAQGSVKTIENTTNMMYSALVWGKEILDKKTFKNILEFPLYVAKEFVEDIPLIHIVTGFLGSGKTTFLREWLSYLQNKDIYMGVIQNEFGQIGLDANLLKEDTVVEALDEGCVCCSLADSLRPGIQRIQALLPRQDIILETSGLANPNNVVIAIKDLDDIVKQGLIISVSDANVLQEALQFYTESYKFNLHGVSLAQIESVDIIVLNKMDLVDNNKLEALRQALFFHNPRALIVESSFGRIAFALLDEIWDTLQLKKQTILNTLIKPMFLANLATHTDDIDGAYTSHVIHFSKPMVKNDIEKLILSSQAIRVKGIVALENDEISIVQHAASRTTFSPLYFELESDEIQEFYLVFIGKNLNDDFLNNYAKA